MTCINYCPTPFVSLFIVHIRDSEDQHPIWETLLGQSLPPEQLPCRRTVHPVCVNSIGNSETFRAILNIKGGPAISQCSECPLFIHITTESNPTSSVTSSELCYQL